MIVATNPGGQKRTFKLRPADVAADVDAEVACQVNRAARHADGLEVSSFPRGNRCKRKQVPFGAERVRARGLKRRNATKS